MHNAFTYTRIRYRSLPSSHSDKDARLLRGREEKDVYWSIENGTVRKRQRHKARTILVKKGKNSRATRAFPQCISLPYSAKQQRTIQFLSLSWNRSYSHSYRIFGLYYTTWIIWRNREILTIAFSLTLPLSYSRPQRSRCWLPGGHAQKSSEVEMNFVLNTKMSTILGLHSSD